jgi:hypothetical protein
MEQAEQKSLQSSSSFAALSTQFSEACNIRIVRSRDHKGIARDRVVFKTIVAKEIAIKILIFNQKYAKLEVCCS